MGREAYLVGFLNRETYKLDGCGIFSEEKPTCNLSKYFLFTILKVTEDTFQEAIDTIYLFLSSPGYSFLNKVLNKTFS